MSEESLRRSFGKTLDDSRADPSRAACPSPEQIAGLVDHIGPEAERMARLAHVTSCAHCLREYELLRSLERGAAAMAPRRRQYSPMLRAATVIVALGLGALAVRNFVAGGAGVERGGTARVSLVSPAGRSSAAAPLLFTWHALAGASGYRVEVLDAAGSARWSASTMDTTAALPDSVHLAAGITYTWWVRAALHGDGERRSRMQPFEVAPR